MSQYPENWLSAEEFEKLCQDELEKLCQEGLEESFFPECAKKPTKETETLVGATSTTGPSTASSAGIQGEHKESVSNVLSSTSKYLENAVQMNRVEPRQVTHSSHDQVQTSGSFMSQYPENWLSAEEFEKLCQDELEKLCQEGLEESFFPECAEKPTKETETLVGTTSTAGPSTASSAGIQGEHKESVSNVFSSTSKYLENAVQMNRVEPRQVTHSSHAQVQTSGSFLNKMNELVQSIGVSTKNQVLSDSAPTSKTSHEPPVPRSDQFFDHYEHNFRTRGKTLAQEPLQSSEPALPFVPQMVPIWSLKESDATASKEDRDYSPAGCSNSAVCPPFLRQVTHSNFDQFQTSGSLNKISETVHFTGLSRETQERFSSFSEIMAQPPLPGPSTPQIPTGSSNFAVCLPHLKPVACSICYQRYLGKHNMKIHRRKAHTEEKPYQCDICDEKFAKKRQLLAHYDIHDGMTLFHCDSCFRIFSCIRKLERHHRFHTDDRPFQCTICAVTYSRQHFLTQHINSCHTFQ